MVKMVGKKKGGGVTIYIYPPPTFLISFRKCIVKTGKESEGGGENSKEKKTNKRIKEVN